MEYRILDFVFCTDAEKEMNRLAEEGWRFVSMTDTQTRGYIVMQREK